MKCHKDLKAETRTGWHKLNGEIGIHVWRVLGNGLLDDPRKGTSKITESELWANESNRSGSKSWRLNSDH